MTICPSCESDPCLCESELRCSECLGDALWCVCSADEFEPCGKRDGGQRWADARKAYNARLREKHTPEQIQAGVERYAAYIRAKGQERTCYVQQAATFLGANKGFLEEWAIIAEPKVAKPVVLTSDQRHVTEMAALMNRRAKIGIPQFRDPNPGETPSQYRLAQDDAFARSRPIVDRTGGLFGQLK